MEEREEEIGNAEAEEVTDKAEEEIGNDAEAEEEIGNDAEAEEATDEEDDAKTEEEEDKDKIDEEGGLMVVVLGPKDNC